MLYLLVKNQLLFALVASILCTKAAHSFLLLRSYFDTTLLSERSLHVASNQYFLLKARQSSSSSSVTEVRFQNSDFHFTTTKRNNNKNKYMRKKLSRPTQTLLYWFWNVVTAIGLRRLSRLLTKLLPAYKNTFFFFEEGNASKGFVALTIDDGLSRGGSETSLVPEVIELLKEYDAHATFFVCSNYINNKQEVVSLLEGGHELGNHLKEDISGYYCKLSKEDFQSELKSSNEVLNQIDQQCGGVVSSRRWFRAPQAIMTPVMRDVINSEGMQSVLADCYCDDWAFADTDASCVAPLMLRQLHSGGSIAVVHMPERGFRELSLHALKEFLEGTKSQNLKCITLTEMDNLNSKLKRN